MGHQCRRCDRRAFPPDPYGCERCGADASQLDSVGLPPTGVVHAVAQVHRHHHDYPAIPFTVATIVLDDGITLKGILDDNDEDNAGGTGIGDRVTAIAVPWRHDDDGNEILDLRFRRHGHREGSATKLA